MGIVVKELNLKVNVKDNTSSGGGSDSMQLSPKKEEEIIAKAISQVMQILEDKKER